jgi:hypothetical protein
MKFLSHSMFKSQKKDPPGLYSKQSPGMPNGGYGQYQMKEVALKQALKGKSNGK